ncbi:HipA domain-containing protein [Dinghuibacter silviterrae]|uniref:Serine/threonine-protein kinase HipA n=1 Tax=Dinghuibacter silviterrae TaxID=1539049 RepID=A0A4R8DRU9_9BACT|nr:HipA domain-containing protein [Dinghuibacter silviterrae]TDX00538.1 serine/threonine-protein kinase HipA [Dinghuibacter silviterrae]
MPNCLICYQDAGNEDYHGRCAKKFFGTDELPTLELNKNLLKQLAEQTINERIALTGVQPKLSVTLDKNKGTGRLTIVGLWGEYILKPQHDSLPAMPETEDLTMHLAGIFGVEVCSHTLLRASDGALVYLARRFDRENNKKIHVEDFCQLSEFLTENKYKGSYERAGKIILTYCTNTGLDILKYFELLLFGYVTGNNDMHLKNFSLIHREDTIDFSPAYDLLNVNLVFPKDQEETALLLNGRKKNIQLRDFEALGTVLGIPVKVRENSYRKFQNHNPAVQQMIQASFLPPEMQNTYWQIWNEKQRLFAG